MSIQENLRELAARWAKVPAGERANYQLYLVELSEALDVPRPQPNGSGYQFEYPLAVVNPNGTTTTKFADLFRSGHFLLEAKDENAAESRDILMRRAFGQARLYAAWLESPPPYLMALDVGRTLVVWDRWSGSYGDYHGGHRIFLPKLAEDPDDIALLRDIWTNPTARDPRGRSERITREVAEDLARLSGSLEKRGHAPEVVARFLIRCVFSMFAEDVGLLPDEPFRRAIQDVGLEDPGEFREAVSELWRAMDTGGRFGLRKFLRFNGHFFKDHTALPLTHDDLRILLEAAKRDWADVEPSIMGTLLTRALDPSERHKLGAEYTPKEFVERLVRPTVEEPIRERWTRVQAEVLQLRTRSGKATRKKKDHGRKALESLRTFHEWLRNLRFLDPACGSGNFLYVTMNLVKQVEFEVFRAIEELTGHPELAVEEVGPWQFHGLEVKAWARELAELTLWIGYHQWWRRTHGHVQPPEPVLRDTGTLEHRDAVLEWDAVEDNPARDRPDPTPRLRHPVTGDLVPDPESRLPYLTYQGARPASWPAADFIVGNPPYMGRGRQREAFGDGYVDALRASYPEVPDNADYVMYWWHRAAEEVAAGRTIRAGLITTNTITQQHNRAVVEHAADGGARVIWTAPDHPWVDETGSAAVRVAMTVITSGSEIATRIDVNDSAEIVRETRVRQLNPDLTVHADVASASKVPLKANAGLSSQGFILVGTGFVLSKGEGERLLDQHPEHKKWVKPYFTGRDLAKRPRGEYAIDFALTSEDQARAHPLLFDLLRDRVKLNRDANARASYRNYWWRFGEPRATFRPALENLGQFIATVETAKHRVFTFLPEGTATSHKIIWIALNDAFYLGVLSSEMHVQWALAAGGRLGVGNDPVYTKSTCFDSFPFPADVPERVRMRIAEIAGQIDSHRKQAIARDERVTMTEMYNVLGKLRDGTELTKKEREIHRVAACSTLRDLHVTLDGLVAAAYGWEWPMDREEILSRFVALHEERVEEEKKGTIRWLRAEYQIPRFGKDFEREQALDLDNRQPVGPDAQLADWPASTLEQIAALQALLASGSLTIEQAASRFRGARREHVARHLETLVIMGEATVDGDGVYQLAPRLPVAA